MWGDIFLTKYLFEINMLLNNMLLNSVFNVCSYCSLISCFSHNHMLLGLC